MSEVRPAYQGELMLAGWTDNHNSGAKVTFWLPDDKALEAFKHMTVRKGRQAGQRFMAVLVEIGDDEQPTDEQPPTSHALAQSAAILCGTPEFQEFVEAQQAYAPASADERNRQCAEYIRTFCRVTTRADLDKSPTAAQAFARLMAAYQDWCRATGART